MQDLVAIVLAGGKGWRLKPDIWTPKPLLKLNDYTLIDHQILWLNRHNIHTVVVVCSDEVSRGITQSCYTVVEHDGRGTGGAVKQGYKRVESKYYYVMNVDDIVQYNPRELYIDCTRGASILVSKPRIRYGVIDIRNNLVINFKEKPYINQYVSAGHYVFKKEIIDQYFPDSGDLELTVLPILARKRLLTCTKFRGVWITINNMKDYIRAREYFKSK